MLALSALAFWPQYLSKFRQANPYMHVHAALGLLWLSLLVVQPLLVRARNLRAHRFVGRGALVAGAAFVISSVLLAHHAAAAMPAGQFAREGFSLYLPFVMAAIFAASICLGLYWRRVPAVHGRFMACSALALVDPLLARILFFYFPPLPTEVLYQVPSFLLIGGILVILLRTLPRSAPGRPAFRAFSATVALALTAYFLTPHIAAWLDFVQWFRSLPIT